MTRFTSNSFLTSSLSTSSIYVSSANQTFISYNNSISPGNNTLDSLVDFNNYLFKYNQTNSIPGYFTLNFDNINKIYESVVFVNLVSQDSAPIFYQDCMSKFINAISGKTVNIQVKSF